MRFIFRVEALYTLKHHSAESVTSDFFIADPIKGHDKQDPRTRSFRSLIDMLTFSLLVLSILSVATCFTTYLEAEDGSTNGRIMNRSRASGGLTVLLKKSGYVKYGFTTSSTCDLIINNVAYSNDGAMDIIRMSISRNGYIGQFTTIAHSNYGHNWNVIRNSGPVGSSTRISVGYHTLTLRAVSSDSYGVELDVLTMTCSTAGGEVESQQSTVPNDNSTSGLSTVEIIYYCWCCYRFFRLLLWNTRCHCCSDISL